VKKTRKNSNIAGGVIPVQSETARRREKKSALKQLIGVLALFIVGTILFYAGYVYINFKMDEIWQASERTTAAALVEIQETNSLNTEILQETLNAILAEMGEIKSTLQEAGQTLDFSTVVQQNLSWRLAELQQQLNELQQAIDLLKD
jgi:hypothetical protein